jgi:hypothetical protein
MSHTSSYDALMSRSRVSTALWLAGLAAAGVGVGVAVTVAVLHKSRSTTETPPEPTEVSDGVVHVIAASRRLLAAGPG